MATTALSITATPGKPHSFSPKAAAAGHTGLFTQLSTIAIPGQRHSFSPKSPVAGHTGLFTQLSTIAVPGKIHSFTAKTLAPAVDDLIGTRSSIYDDHGGYRKLISVHKDDEEILQTIIAFVLSE